MAITKLLSIKARVDNRVRYICNKAKTRNNELVSSYNCEAERAFFDFDCTATLAELSAKQEHSSKHSIRAYHLIQSFSPNDNITPEEAHRIGRELADQLLGGRYEYVIATHTDKKHIHNHIIFNSVSFLDLRKFRTQPFKTAQQIRSISDRLCTEHGLSVLPEPQRLGYSYAEWMARRDQTSWRAELRKRLRFVMERANSYDEFLQMCGELQVTVNDSGKHIKFMLRDLPQERWVRGNKLSDDDSLTLPEIKTRLAENAKERALLVDTLKAQIPLAHDLHDLTKRLLETSDIRVTQGKRGLRFAFPDGSVRSSAGLGTAFSQEALERDLRIGHFDEAVTPADLRTEWEEQQQSLTSAVQYIPIVLPPDAVEKISLDGLLVRVPGDTEDEVFFLDNAHVDFDEDTQEYTAWIAPPYQYFCVPQQLDPDRPESEQLSGTPHRGMELIRRMERAWGGEAEWVDIPSAWVVTANQQGLLLSVPELSTKWIRIEPQDFSLNASGCRVRLFPHWSYGKDLFGSELITAADQQTRTPIIDLLWIRCRSYQRRSQRAEVDALSAALRTMEREGINTNEDFSSAAQHLENLLTQSKQEEQANQAELQECTQSLTSLKVLAEHHDLFRSWQQATKQERAVLEQQYPVPLRMCQRALGQLRQAGVDPSTDPQKLEGYLQFLKQDLERCKDTQNQIQNRLDAVEEAYRIAKAAQKPATLTDALRTLQQPNHTLR